jgi:hypothetical protein
MNKEMYDEVVRFLKILADGDNWEHHDVHDKFGDWLGSYYTWENNYYDPMYMAQELLDTIDNWNHNVP